MSEKLIQLSKERFSFAQAKIILKEKYEAKLTFAHAGGMWRAGPELLVLLAVAEGKTVILDLYENPVRVDAREFREIVYQRWQEQMNAWLAEHDALGKQR